MSVQRTREPRSKCYWWNAGTLRQEAEYVKRLLRDGNVKGALVVLKTMSREMRCQGKHHMHRKEIVDGAFDYFEERT